MLDFSDCMCASGSPVCATLPGIGEVSLESICVARCKGYDATNIVDGVCNGDTVRGISIN